MTEQMTALDALDALTRVVKREGHDTVRKCKYVALGDDDWPAPHCIVACVLADRGISVEDLDTLGACTIDDLYMTRILERYVDCSPQAIDILRRAQQKQDSQCPWGNALAAARRMAWRLGVIGKEHPRRHKEKW